MQKFQAEIIVRRKQLQINGPLRKAGIPYADFIREHLSPESLCLQSISNRLGYVGSEFTTSLFFCLCITVAEIFNCAATSTNSSYELGIIISVFYVLIFSTVINVKIQLLLHVLCIIAALVTTVLTFILGGINYYVVIGILATTVVTFIAKLIVLLQDHLYSQNTNTGFTFESNLIYAVFLLWKFYQLVLNQIGVYTFNYNGLLSSLFVLTLINITKIHSLFDYDILHVVNIFQQVSNTSPPNVGSSKLLPSNSISIFVDPLNQEVQVDNESQSNENSSIIYESRLRMITTAAFALVSVGYLFYLVLNSLSLSSNAFNTIILTAATSYLRTCLLLATCEYQKVIKSQTNDIIKYMLIWLGDIFWICLAYVIISQSSLLSLSTESNIINWMSPLVVIKLFNQDNKQVHTQLNNRHYCTVFLLYILPLSVRQLPDIMGLTFLQYTLDAIALTYASFTLILWNNTENITSLYRQVSTALKQTNYKLQLFHQLKIATFDYQSILQSFIYTHIIILGISYFYISTTMTLNITYFIIFLSPCLLYLGCLNNCSNYTQSIPQTYRPSLISILALLLNTLYIVVAYSNVIDVAHQTWSLTAGMNTILFTIVLQSDKMAVVYIPKYTQFLRVMIITIFFILIYLPFITIFISGYYYSSFSSTYLYYYSLSGFFYIWLFLTLIGVSIHWILNLTAKSQKDLFIAQYMSTEMQNINMKENVEKILMISNMYEQLNENSQELLKYLKKQQNITVIVHSQKSTEYDYELVQSNDPLASQKMSVKSKPIDTLDLINLIKIKQSKQAEDTPQNEHPVVLYFKQKQRNRIQIIKPNNYNSNYEEIKRISYKHRPIDHKQLQHTEQFIQFKADTDQRISQTMALLYLFLSQPSPHLSPQTFTSFFQILQNHKEIDATHIYDHFIHSLPIDQITFKNFIIEYTEYKYDLVEQPLKHILRTFCCRQIAPLIQGTSQLLKCFLNRKNTALSTDSKQLWFTQKPTPQKIQTISTLQQRQLKKKAVLLHIPNQKKTELKQLNNQNQEDTNNELQLQLHNTNSSEFKKQLKDKKLMTPQSVYASLVNSLIECFLYYEKQTENFKVKTVKLTLSNALAVLAKISDIVFIFAYPTVSLLILYLQNNLTQIAYIFSSVSYAVLISIASFSVLVYILLLFYHKKDFEAGRLGVDQNMRSFDFHDVKYYTICILFLLGSGLANYIMSIGLNSFICSTNTLYNFSDTSCNSSLQYIYMLLSLLILVLYWPLAAITFPFFTAQDRNLQIKYKSQYQIIYLQFKFLINGYNTLLNPLSFEQQQFIISVLRVFVCCALAFLFYRMDPCSYQLLNRIEGKIYILVSIMSFAGALCYLIGLQYACIVTGSLMALYLIYFIYTTVKNYTSLSNQNEQDDIIQDNIKNQNIKIQILSKPQTNAIKNSNIAKSRPHTKTQKSVMHIEQIDDRQSQKTATKLMPDKPRETHAAKPLFSQYQNTKKSIFF